MKVEDLMYFNGFGGFSKDGKEYIIKVSKNGRTPVPWSHILTNDKIGTLVTSNGGGFSWYGNSRENKISSWHNDMILDTSSERIMLEDGENVWSAFSDSILENEEYEVIYGFGYAKYRLLSKRYEQEVDVFVTENPYQKVNIFKIKNLENKTKKINIKYEIDTVLGVSKEYTSKHIVSNFENDYLKIYNRYNNDYSDYNFYMKAICSDEINIKEIDYNKVTNYKGVEFDIEIESEEEKEIVFVLDYRKDSDAVAFENLGYYRQEFEKVKDEWKNKLEKVQVTTPIDSMNIILNGWILYQSLASRIWGRASFYQSGGAFGFRDQLQDMLAILYIEPEMVRQQIIYHAQHQFKEGDVLHWWHPERSNGIRTRFSDDLLWLVYVTCEYIQYTGDFEILEEDIPFIDGRILNDNEDEVYIETKNSDESSTLLEHCVRAINRSLDFGEHGLPKMGSGDWNDGMNAVGGESIWLGFFLADILKKFLTIVKDERFKKLLDKNVDDKEINSNNEKIDIDNYENNDKIQSNDKKQNSDNYKADINEKRNNIKKFGFENEKDFTKLKEYYETKYFELQRNLDKAWDGRWFKRAYFKNGDALGSNQNDECKIDNISQSWSVISGVAKKDKQEIAMESVENYLVDHENMFIKLLTPAFCDTKMEPGYIKSYIPGVRENGGQYTHGAIWAIMANCILGKNDVATEYFRMLNPIEHARTKEDAIKYKSEPYVIVADIYSHPNLIGRGGWSWYTGSASWYFVAGVKYILGLNKIGEFIEIKPRFPKSWNNCYIKFEVDETTYLINMIKEEKNASQEKTADNKFFDNNMQDFNMIIFVDNEKCETNRIKIVNDGGKHIIDVKLVDKK